MESPSTLRPASAILLVLAVFGSRGWAHQEAASPALASLVAAERAFAARSVEKGMRDAFLAFFADDGINFSPHPVNTREALGKQAAPAGRPPVTLNWEPAYADISTAGDLGYTTGPYVLTDNAADPKPARHGYYFSVWKRQANGNWKVVLDYGIQTPAPPPSSSARPPLRAARTPGRPSAASRSDVSAPAKADAELTVVEGARGTRPALLEAAFDDETRLYRDGMFPIVGRESIGAFLIGKPLLLAWEPLRSDVARSDDLGYSYGRFAQRPAGAQTPSESGYYAHVWKRDPDGKWRVALEVARLVPPEQK